MKIFHHNRIIRTGLVWALISLSFYGTAQESSPVSRIQRAIYIYNIAQQVSWPDDLSDTFSIGVLGPDRTAIDFKAMAQKRQIKSLPVTVVNFLSVKDVRGVDILYVHSKFNFEMPYILQSLKDRGVLVISEDYMFNASMINIVKVGNTFRHQINEQVLSDNGFAIAPSLKLYAIKSSEKWMSLFKEAQDSLNIAKKRVRIKDSLIIKQEQELVSKNELLDTIQEIVNKKDNSIQELLEIGEIQKKTIEEKRAIAQELEFKIKDQIDELKKRNATLQLRTNEIRESQDSIVSQKKAIDLQKNELDRQSFELTLRENINWFLSIIAGLLFLAGFIAFKNYKAKDRLSKELALKNTKITIQSDKIKQKNEELEQFAYIASHDLQEPLNTITSFAGLVKSDYKDRLDDIGRQSLDFIKDASIRMTRLIEVLLEYSKIGENRVFVPVNCNVLIQDLEKDLTSLIKRKNATVIYSNLPIVKGSEVELRLLFQNLITNGLKFCPEERKPVLKINAVQTTNPENINQKVWQFSFTDNGIGIRKDHQDRIFSIFQRLHTNEEYEGTGIGLAHCKKIVTTHRGDIWLKSDVGKGSTFYFTIPY